VPCLDMQVKFFRQVRGNDGHVTFGVQKLAFACISLKVKFDKLMHSKLTLSPALWRDFQPNPLPTLRERGLKKNRARSRLWRDAPTKAWTRRPVCAGIGFPAQDLWFGNSNSRTNRNYFISNFIFISADNFSS
jgi:hypothetical protein